MDFLVADPGAVQCLVSDIEFTRHLLPVASPVASLALTASWLQDARDEQGRTPLDVAVLATPSVSHPIALVLALAIILT